MPHVFCSQLFGFFPLGLCGWQPRNRQIHRQVCWKRHRISGVVGKERNIGFVGFLRNVEPKWCGKYRKWLCCEIFVTKSKLKASLAVWGIFYLTFFREGCSPSRRAAPVYFNDNLASSHHSTAAIVINFTITSLNLFVTPPRIGLF